MFILVIVNVSPSALCFDNPKSIRTTLPVHSIMILLGFTFPWIQQIVASGESRKWDVAVLCHVLLFSTVCPVPVDSGEREVLMKFHQWNDVIAHGIFDDQELFDWALAMREFIRGHPSAFESESKNSEPIGGGDKALLAELADLDQQLLAREERNWDMLEADRLANHEAARERWHATVLDAARAGFAL